MEGAGKFHTPLVITVLDDSSFTWEHLRNSIYSGLPNKSTYTIISFFPPYTIIRAYTCKENSCLYYYSVLYFY